MIWLLATNVVSEPGKPRPHPKLAAWLSAVNPEDCAISVLTIGELTKGVRAMAFGQSRRKHEAALAALRLRFSNRILPVTELVAEKWGELLAGAGRPLPAVDNLIAATALVHGLTLATRDTGDIATGVGVFNPFE